MTDSTSAVVPGAAITLININTNAARNAVSTDSGDYTFPSIPPGFYTVKAEHVQVQQTVRLDFALQVGQVKESIEVSAKAVLLQADIPQLYFGSNAPSSIPYPYFCAARKLYRSV